MSKTQDEVLNLIKEARRPEKVVPVCMRGDLVAEFEALEAELVELDRGNATTRKSLAGPDDGGRGLAIAEQMEDLRDQMREATIEFRFRAVSGRRWSKAITDHPPRRTEDGEMLPNDRAGMNTESFFEQLVPESCVWPELDAATWKQLLTDTLTDSQVQALSQAVFDVNRGDVDIPFSRAASRKLQQSGRKSKPQNG